MEQNERQAFRGTLNPFVGGTSGNTLRPLNPAVRLDEHTRAASLPDFAHTGMHLVSAHQDGGGYARAHASASLMATAM
ncbi:MULTISPECIES: hypothetical protein [unclassified Caballeronia]|uniref:hypothetical protein n=1 Tax=unclassified Caballeronia TaxID=2646786 RepID=UPI0028596EED|nr:MULTISPECIES: hypothetical protein [unclassified Caballeronia]MDR5751087.1 hypothetical protein [Caballeronia sp. LZ024]MDR5844778.1 hypothetical protein [Caballeronia sp. LZ031]